MVSVFVLDIMAKADIQDINAGLKFFVCVRMFQGYDLPCTAVNANVEVEQIMRCLNEINVKYVKSVKNKLIAVGVSPVVIENYINSKGCF